MKMQITIAIACLGLLISVEPPSAQIAGERKEYSLTVSVHEDAPRLTKKEVEEILEGASKLLKHCDVTFKLKGEIQTFALPTPAVIRTADERDAVHRVDADVKVVQKIEVCRRDLGADDFNGCAFPPSEGSKSIIVAHANANTPHLRSILWAHEFGHRAGLPHRAAPDALMTACQNLSGDQEEVNKHECRCFRSGPGGGCKINLDVRPQCGRR